MFPAIVRSWKAPYLGNADRALYQHVFENRNSDDRVTPVIQALGSGKSRTVDQLSRSHLVIPVNLSPEGCYPPPDSTLRDWLLKKSAKATIRRTSKHHIDALAIDNGRAFFYTFYAALFQTTARYIRKGIRVAIEKEDTLDELQKSRALKSFPTSFAGQFRLFMSLGQTYHTQGILRRRFYQDVMEVADYLSLPHDIYSESDSGFSDEECSSKELYDHVKHAAEELIQVLVDVGYLNSDDVNAEDFWSFPPTIFVSFDGAESMMRYYVSEDGSYWSRMSSVRCASAAFSCMPISTLLLSSAWLPIQPTPLPPPGRSDRITLGGLSMTPFSFLGFDNLLANDNSTKDRSWTLEQVTQPEFWLKLGRPLWGRRFQYGCNSVKGGLIEYAAQLLLGGRTQYDAIHLSESQLLAVLAPRLALEFKPGSRHPGVWGGDIEMNQVEKHLRICLALNPNSSTVATCTIAASEPTVVEAAAWIMRRKGFESYKALRYVMQNTKLSRGNGGELVMANIIIDALDECTFDKEIGTRSRFVVPVTDFFKRLLRRHAFDSLMQALPSHGVGSFAEIFKESKMFVTHFIKILDPAAITQDVLVRCMVRGAAIISSNGNSRIDLVLPFLRGGNKLRPSNVSAILVQAPLDASYSSIPRLECFDRMDAFIKQLFPNPNGEAFPVIRLVCALKAQTQGDQRDVTPSGPAYHPDRVSARRAGPHELSYTTFDIWCAGAPSRAFRNIRTNADKVYEELLDMVTSEVWMDHSPATVIDNSAMRQRASSLYPSATALNGSWARFAAI
ncbi:hypothetical protein OBBRIDRAFT_839140 [Obba rivulosa]|uniref:Uncharacterized protein n=1 Tax=Obba rivulosa TaxID=1052685 RepID=A0A8E2DFV0_9APHY|nr:hypothetical protein OBBRIDRAFT_839140 [Obba rivulosa]